jgi:hypothetical protein
MTRIRRKSLFVDPMQGFTENGRAFGFIGTNDAEDYQGWFFEWPSDRPAIEDEAEAEAVIGSLEADQTCTLDEQIRLDWAKWLLKQHLKRLIG